MSKLSALIISCFVLFFSIRIVHAQDIHTTQIAEHDYLYNPGLIGNYHGNSRIQFSTRSQWTNINNAFETYSFFSDFKIGVEKWKKGNLGICFAANADDAGDGFLKKNSFNLGLSSVIKLSNTSSLSLGFLNTYNQLTIDPSNIMWGSQFNGEYHDPNISSGENFAKNAFGYYNIATGIAFTYGKEEGYMSLYDQTHIQVGLSTYNILSPNSYNSILNDTVQQRYCLYGKGFLGIPHTRTGIMGSFLTQLQGPNLEIILGAYYRIRIKEASKITGYNKESAIALGGVWRYGDALCPGVLFEIKDYAIGISYDMTLSKLLPATNTMGAVEVVFRIQTNNQFLYKGYSPGI